MYLPLGMWCFVSEDRQIDTARTTAVQGTVRDFARVSRAAVLEGDRTCPLYVSGRTQAVIEDPICGPPVWPVFCPKVWPVFGTTSSYEA